MVRTFRRGRAAALRHRVAWQAMRSCRRTQPVGGALGVVCFSGGRKAGLWWAAGAARGMDGGGAPPCVGTCSGVARTMGTISRATASTSGSIARPGPAACPAAGIEGVGLVDAGRRLCEHGGLVIGGMVGAVVGLELHRFAGSVKPEHRFVFEAVAAVVDRDEGHEQDQGDAGTAPPLAVCRNVSPDSGQHHEGNRRRQP
jgi:hypothetical protein